MNTSTNEPDLPGVQPEVHNPEVSYDTTDLSARGVVFFLIFLAIGGVLVTGATWGVYKYIARAVAGPNPIAGPMAASRQELRSEGVDPALRFPPPQLQADPVADFNRFHEREQEILNSYGWVDQANGKVRIPIERAIDQVAATGLPVRPNVPAVSPGAARASGTQETSRGTQ